MAFLYKKKRLIANIFEKQLLLLISTITIATLGIYLATKNPVWNYHFISIEILFLLLIGLIAKKSKIFKYLLVVWALILLLVGTINYVKGLGIDRYKISSLATEEHIVNTIYEDANGKSFAVYIYSPAKFTPDFNYLFRWKGTGKNTAMLDYTGKAQLVYLIIPWTTNDLREDFIDNRTSNEEYKTVKTWHIADETDILKRVHYEKK